MICKLRRRLNKEIDGVFYWKWYVDIPANYVSVHELKQGDPIIVKKGSQ